MFRKIIKAGVVLSLILSLTAGCGQKANQPKEPNTANNQYVQEVVDAIVNDPATLDPGVCNFVDEINIAAQLFEGLYRKGANGKIELGTAEGVQKSSDNLTYTFKIRKDAKWSDGKPVTAYDFEYGWKRVVTPGFENDVDYLMYFIKDAEKHRKGQTKELGVKAINAQTLVVKLEKPISYFDQILTLHTYYPVRKDIVEKNPKLWATYEDTLIGNGPFKISKWEKGDNIPYIEVVKNNNYWDNTNVKLTKITTKVISNAEAQWESFHQGKIDIGSSIPQDKDINQLIKDKEVVSAPTLTTEYYIFNISRKPFNDIKVRKAISMVVDREGIINQVNKGSNPATAFVPFGMPDKNVTLDFRKVGGDYLNPKVTESNINEARKLLAEAGYPEGKGIPTIKLLVNNTAKINSIATIFKENLKKNLDINVEVSSLETSLFKEERTKGNFDICRMRWVADFSDASNFLEIFLSDSSNSMGRWINKKYDTLLKEASNSLDEAVRMEKLHQAEKILIEEASIVPIYFDTNIFFFKSYVKNYTKSALEEKNFRIISIDKNR